MTRGQVLFAPRNISGQSTEMAEAVGRFDYAGEVWSFGEPAFGFDADRVFDMNLLRSDPDGRWRLLDEAVRRFDVFHFQFSRSLVEPLGVTMPELWDLPLLKSLGKKVFMHFRGSDVRLRSKHIEREPESYFHDAEVVCDEPRIQGRIAIARRFCDAMFVSTPGLLDYVPDAHWIPHTIQVRHWQRPSRDEPDVPVVAHIPSSRGTKGSGTIDAALQNLAASGVCRYRTLSSIDHQHMRDVLHEVDIVVDSIGIGDYGLISVEAMAAGAIAVGHVHENNRDRNPGVPVVEATGPTLEGVVGNLCRDPARRRRLRKEAGAWVAHRHDRSEVGRLLAGFYERPPTVPDLSFPNWPRSDSRRRTEKLEAELEKRRSMTAESVVIGARSNATSLPSFVLDRLLKRTRDLEKALEAVQPGSPLLHSSPRIRLQRSDLRAHWVRLGRLLRSFVYRHPRIHGVASRAKRALGSFRLRHRL